MTFFKDLVWQTQLISFKAKNSLKTIIEFTKPLSLKYITNHSSEIEEFIYL